MTRSWCSTKVAENTKGILGGSRYSYSEAANLAINQTLMRSINTSIIALLPVAGLLFIGAGLLGAGTLKDLGLVLFIGMMAGAYSSIFLAAPITAELKEREPRYKALAKRVAARRAAATGAPKPAATSKSTVTVTKGGSVDADVDGDDDGETVGAGASKASGASSTTSRPAQRKRPGRPAGPTVGQQAPPVTVSSGAGAGLGAGLGAGPGPMEVADLIAAHVVDVPDFPKPGVLFKDLTPLFGDGPTLRACADAIVAAAGPFDLVAGIEARGFIVAAAVAYATGTGVIPVRKAGKLPGPTTTITYELEYGTATLEIPERAGLADRRVLLVDDVLATGGTVVACFGAAVARWRPGGRRVSRTGVGRARWPIPDRQYA